MFRFLCASAAYCVDIVARGLWLCVQAHPPQPQYHATFGDALADIPQRVQHYSLKGRRLRG